MIFTRCKDAEALHKVFRTENNPFFFGDMMSKSEKIDIIYPENNRMKTISFTEKFLVAVKAIGELERKNLPFILLRNTKCHIEQSKGYTTVINADCITQEQLEKCFSQEDLKQKNKSRLFDILFSEYLLHNQSKNFYEDFYSFSRFAASEEFKTKDIVFLAAEGKSIHNSNWILGKFYNDGKIWFFNEKYDYDAEKIDMIKTNGSTAAALMEFSKLYEGQKAGISKWKLCEYNEDEITAIIRRYPEMFAQLVLKNTAWYKKPSYDDMHQEPDDINYDDENDLGNYIEKHSEEVAEAPEDTKMCFSCGNYVHEACIRACAVEGKIKDLCDECLTGYDIEPAE